MNKTPNNIINSDSVEPKDVLLSATHSTAPVKKESSQKEKQNSKTVDTKTRSQKGPKAAASRSKAKQIKKADHPVPSKQKVQKAKEKSNLLTGDVEEKSVVKGNVSKKVLKKDKVQDLNASSKSKSKNLKTAQKVESESDLVSKEDSGEKDFIDQLKGIVNEPANSFENEAVKSEQERAQRKPFPDVSLNDEEISLVLPKKAKNSKHFAWALVTVGLVISVECYIHRKPHNLPEHLAHVSDHTVVQRIEKPKSQNIIIPQNTKTNAVQVIESKEPDTKELKVSSMVEATPPTITSAPVSSVSSIEKLKPLPNIHLSDKISEFQPLNQQNFEFVSQSVSEPILAKVENVHQKQAITEHIDTLLKEKNAIQENLMNQVRDWLYKQHIQGVAYKETKSCLILNSKVFYVGDIINTSLNLVWTDIDPAKKQLHFQDASGNAYVTSY